MDNLKKKEGSQPIYKVKEEKNVHAKNRRFVGIGVSLALLHTSPSFSTQ